MIKFLRNHWIVKDASLHIRTPGDGCRIRINSFREGEYLGAIIERDVVRFSSRSDFDEHARPGDDTP